MKVERTAILPFASQQMFDIINDIEQYPDFLPWCSDARVERHDETEMLAMLAVKYGRLNLKFKTLNTLVLNEKVSMTLVEGPFKNLQGEWQITALNDSACKVTLNMNFAFSNPITHGLFAKVFQSVVTTQVDAFEQRAHSIYNGK